MPEKILVATPDPVFGEWLRSSLAENGGYEVQLATNGSEVLFLAAANPYALALLDSELPGEPFVPLARGLMALIPDLRLLVIPPENNPQHPTLAGLVPHGYITRPCYLMELLDMIRSLLASRITRKVGQEGLPLLPATPGLTWLEDPAQAGQLLSRLLLETTAQAVLVCAEGKVWAFAGQISAASAQETALQLGADWQDHQSPGLARYIRLVSAGSDHFLYAVSLLEDLTLVLLYDPSAPLTRAHTQSGQLAAALVGQAAPNPLPVPVVTVVTPEDAPAADEVPVINTAEIEDILQLPAQPETWVDEANDEDAEEGPQINLSRLLAGMPSPDPDGPPLFTDHTDEWQVEDAQETAWFDRLPEEEPSFEEARLQSFAPGPESEPVSGIPTVEDRLDAIAAAPKPDLPAVGDGLKAIAPALEPELIPATPAAEMEVPAWLWPDMEANPTTDVPHEQTHPLPNLPFQTTPMRSKPGGNGNHGQELPLARALPTRSDLCYTCILIPDHPDHYLTGTLASRLNIWFPQFCLGFGWRLESLNIQPSYVQWTIQLDPNVSAGRVVAVLRQRTSQSIFNQFANLRAQITRNDFWAPGYLAVHGTQPPPAHQLRDFIQQVRLRQGYINY